MKKGLTLVELLTVLAIIAMLVGLIVPSTFVVRRFARETKQKAEFASMGVALTLFRNDYGEYPPSVYDQISFTDYCGAQKLAEALLGRDLLGFHPQSQWELNDSVYDDVTPEALRQRKSRYYETGTTNVFQLGIGAGEGLFVNTGPLAPETFVMCDVFRVRDIKLANNKRAMAGTPILYYRANATSKIFDDAIGWPDLIYNAYDNFSLIGLGVLQSDGSTKGEHWLYGNAGGNFYSPEYKVVDPTIKSTIWPRNPESYLLISAGHDGEYGTADDITNFE